MNAMQHKRGPLFLGCCIQWLDAESLGRRIEIRYIHTPRRDERREIRKRTFFFSSLSVFFFLFFSFLVRFGCCFCHSHAVAATAAVEKARGSIRNGDADEEGVCQFVTTVRVSGHCAPATSTTPNAISSSIRLVPGERLFVLLQHDNIDS